MFADYAILAKRGQKSASVSWMLCSTVETNHSKAALQEPQIMSVLLKSGQLGPIGFWCFIMKAHEACPTTKNPKHITILLLPEIVMKY